MTLNSYTMLSTALYILGVLCWMVLILFVGWVIFMIIFVEDIVGKVVWSVIIGLIGLVLYFLLNYL